MNAEFKNWCLRGMRRGLVPGVSCPNIIHPALMEGAIRTFVVDVNKQTQEPGVTHQMAIEQLLKQWDIKLEKL